MADVEQSSPAIQQASGPSVFWALACIVINAMAQPSFCASLANPAGAQGAINPYRSSPIVCILDAVADILVTRTKWKKSSVTSSRRSSRKYPNLPAKPTDIIIRLAIFLFGVMPQVVRIFSIRGGYMWVTQLLAAIYLMSTLASMARGLCLAAPQEDFLLVVENLREFRVDDVVRRVVAVLTGASHFIFLWLVCSFISHDGIHIPASENVALSAWMVDTWLSILCNVYLVQEFAFGFAGSRSPLGRQPILIVLYMTNNLGVLSLIGEQPRRISSSAWTSVLAIMLLSLLVTSILDVVAGKLLRLFRGSRAPEERVEFQPGGGEELDTVSSWPQEGVDIPDRDYVQGISGGEQSAATRGSSRGRSPLRDHSASRGRRLSRGRCPSCGRCLSCGRGLSPDPDHSLPQCPTAEAANRTDTSSPAPPLVTDGDHQDDQQAPAPAAEREEAYYQDVPELFIFVQQAMQTHWRKSQPSPGFIARYCYSFLRWSVHAFGKHGLSTIGWVYRQLSKLSVERVMVAVAVGNFWIAVLYYMVYFDGEGTTMPGWTQVLG